MPDLSERVLALTRPHPNLFKYYALASLVFGPFFPVALLVRYFRYHTLRYAFDGEGVTVRWGILFRREISLTYARIQDIHLVSNLVERWLGLARVQIQTAAGSAVAEMTVEGFLEYEMVRDFLYERMRGGGRSERPPAREAERAPAAAATAALLEASAQIRALRRELEERRQEDGA